MELGSLTAMPARRDGASAAPEVWIGSRRWDLFWLFGTASVVPFVLIAVWAGASADVINIGTTALVGGPHLFSTYTATYLDPGFRRGHRLSLLAVSLAVPAVVIYAAVTHYQVLISVFIFAASLHVLQQNAYLADIYRTRAALPEARLGRWLDYGVLMLAFYPIAAVRLVRGDFSLGDVKILIPGFLLVPATYWVVGISFAVALLLWTGKTWREWRRGTLNRPKTLLIGLTAIIAFSIPALESSGRLELAFQAVNAWHSMQYLGVVILIAALRNRRGELASPAQVWLASGKRPGARMYLACAAVTGALVAVIVAFARMDPFHLPFQQYWFMAVLSVLLIHYLLDGYLFAFAVRRGRSSDLPYAALAT